MARFQRKAVLKILMHINSNISNPAFPIFHSGKAGRTFTSKALSYGEQWHFPRFSRQQDSKEPEKDLQQLKAMAEEITHLKQVRDIVRWDQFTYMPTHTSTIEQRGKQLASLTQVIQDRLKSTRFKNILSRLHGVEIVDPLDRSLVQYYKQRVNIADKLPCDLLRQTNEAETQAQFAWSKAKRTGDFSLFLPHLKTLVALSRKKVEHLNKLNTGKKRTLGYHPYDPLLAQHAPGIDVKRLDRIFKDVSSELQTLLKQIELKQNLRSSDRSTKGAANLTNPADTMKELAFIQKELLEPLGIDFSRARLDTSSHPRYISVSPSSDVRVMIRKGTDTIDALEKGFALHEAGHALYAQNGNPLLELLPDVASTALDESQALLIQNHVGKSKEFLRYLLPKLKETFPDRYRYTDLENYYRKTNTIKASAKRMDADEVTYMLHILVRYELEKGMIEGTIPVDKKLPERWNQKMADYLGVIPDNDREGILQDAHWADSDFGYFPTYALGQLYAAQFYHAARQQIPDLDANIRRGNFKPLEHWLSRNIHCWGRQMVETPEDLLRAVTGEGLNPQYFIDYLWQKYSELYSIRRPAYTKSVEKSVLANPGNQGTIEAV
ncbi:MAG: carboxypeptidase M32 [Vampirovibrio sp.]|nr:carboxypeptidase M32 [Vampirovibrio sp.]